MAYDAPRKDPRLTRIPLELGDQEIGKYLRLGFEELGPAEPLEYETQSYKRVRMPEGWTHEDAFVRDERGLLRALISVHDGRPNQFEILNVGEAAAVEVCGNVSLIDNFSCDLLMDAELEELIQELERIAADTRSAYLEGRSLRARGWLMTAKEERARRSNSPKEAL